MLQSRGELYLATKAICIQSGGKFWWENLDYDLAIELDVGRNEYMRHSGAAQLPVDAISVAEDFLKLNLKIGRLSLLRISSAGI